MGCSQEFAPVLKKVYYLTFAYTFRYDNDTVFFANCFPYT